MNHFDNFFNCILARKSFWWEKKIIEWKPSGKTIEVKPELIIETRNKSVFAFGILNSTKNFIIHFKFLTVMARIRVWLHRSASATLNVVLDHHERASVTRIKRNTIRTVKKKKNEKWDRDKLKKRKNEKGKRKNWVVVDEKLFYGFWVYNFLLLLWNWIGTDSLILASAQCVCSQLSTSEWDPICAQNGHTRQIIISLLIMARNIKCKQMLKLFRSMFLFETEIVQRQEK